MTDTPLLVPIDGDQAIVLGELCLARLELLAACAPTPERDREIQTIGGFCQMMTLLLGEKVAQQSAELRASLN